MMRVSVGVLGICLCLVGCGGADREAADEKTAEVRPIVVTETGCLTARGDQFVLTDLQRGEGEATTETFELIGNGEMLRPHVGRQVRVNGEAEAPKVAMVQESSPAPAEPAPQGTTGSAKSDAKVSTQTQTRVEVRKLTVSSVEPTGSSCAAEAKSGEAAPQRPRQ